MSDDTMSRRELGPVQFAVATLLQPTERHFRDLDDVADCYEFMESIQPDDAFHVLHAALEYIKLSRSLLRVCDDFYDHHIDAVPMGEMRQIVHDSRLDAMAQKPSSSRSASPAKGGQSHSPARQVNDDGHGWWPAAMRADDESPNKLECQQHLPPVRHWLHRLQDVFSMGLPKVSFANEGDDPEEVLDDAAPLISNDALAHSTAASSSPAKASDHVRIATAVATMAATTEADVPAVVVHTIQSMLDFPSNLKLQFRGLHTVAEFANVPGTSMALALHRHCGDG
ncbi:hypothetical protein DYB32_002791 [Aphanomyces invadans]|uniref:Uncharacterized protein n=1 Tax=Aphanomyces invadans TaxID=157072 RepID=A0A3R6ZTE7_9STRA|nr:hypothetical protein DYB32_002791 [Aphanomyces invadans]